MDHMFSEPLDEMKVLFEIFYTLFVEHSALALLEEFSSLFSFIEILKTLG